MITAFISRFRYSLIFLTSLLVLIILFAVVMMSYKPVGQIIQTGYVAPKYAILVFFVDSLLLLFGYFLIRLYSRSSPKVVMTPQHIRIGKTLIPIDEVATVEIFGTSEKAMKYTFTRNPEVSSIILHDGRKFDLFIDHYQNGSLIRKNLSKLDRFLRRQDSQFSITLEQSKTPAPAYDFEPYEEYTGSIFRFFTFYVSALGGLFFLFLIVSFSFTLGSLLVAVSSCCFLYFLTGWQTHYFWLTDRHVIIKNLLLPWRERIIPLTDIILAEHQTMHKQETSLKLVTSDFRLHRFQSGLLNKSTFDSLVSDINNKRLTLVTPTEALSLKQHSITP